MLEIHTPHDLSYFIMLMYRFILPTSLRVTSRALGQSCDRSQCQWWRHQMKTFSAGNSLVISEFLHKGQRRGNFMFSLICAWTYGWINNPGASDLMRHRAHYDVTAMQWNNPAGPLFTKRTYVLPRSREVSKKRDSGLDFSNRSGI